MSGQYNPKDGVCREVFCGISWFTNYHTIEAMWEQGFHYFGQVKTGHAQTPKEWLDEEMAPYCPGSWIVLEHESLSGVPMICIGYKYSWSKVSTFLMTKGCGDTTPGRLYRMNCVCEDGVRYHKDVGRPDVVTRYYDACGVIDHHNHSHQGTVANQGWVVQDLHNNVWDCAHQ